MLGGIKSWEQLSMFLPENMLTDDIIYNCSILASTFSATLELAKSGNIELKQKEAFGKIMIRTKNL